MRSLRQINLARLLIAMVFFFNVQCALVFIISPERYAPGFEVSGAVGNVIIRSIGILFLMWNVPYAVALGDPVRHALSLTETLIMQAIGLFGETVLLATLEPGHAALRNTAQRFIIFDGLGLIALLFAAYIAAGLRRSPGNAR
jgi:hypothetical protein